MADLLDTYATVVLNASGNGTVILTPDAFRMWVVTALNVRTSQAPTVSPVPQCTVYLGMVGDGNIICQTWNGSRASASGTPIHVQPSQPLIVTWENGVPGTSATASIYGSMSMR